MVNKITSPITPLEEVEKINEIIDALNVTHYGTCDTAAATQEKVVACTGFKLETGAIICVRFTAEANGASNPTLNVNSTGAKAIRYRNSAIDRGYLRINRTYIFVYDGTYYQLIGDLDSNNVDRLQINNNIKAETAITAGRAIVGTSAGYKNIGSGITFDISYPILVAGSAISASGTGTNNFRAISGRSVRDITGNSSWTGTQWSTLYLVLSALNGVTATIDSTLVTTTVPASADNKFYIPLGYMYSTYQCYFCPQDKIYAYINGAFREIAHTAVKATQDGSGNTITSYYQPKLTSGTNIKTINGSSVLGSGDLTVSGTVDYKSLIDTIYPVGSIYIGVTSECPLAAIKGTWVLKSSGRVLQGADSNHLAGSTIEAGLPNITGKIESSNGTLRFDSQATQTGSLSMTFKTNAATGGNYNGINSISFDASRSSSIYGKSTTVQPPAYVVNIWQRTA